MTKEEGTTKSRLRNVAFIFIKPHANNPKVQKLVRTMLLENDLGLKVTYSTEIDGAHIEDSQLIDQHYFSIASKATLLPPENMGVPADKFEVCVCVCMCFILFCMTNLCDALQKKIFFFFCNTHVLLFFFCLIMTR